MPDPELKVEAPAIVSVPLSVIAPDALTERLAAVNACKSNAVASTIVTALPLSVENVTAPVKVFPEESSVMAAFVPAVFVNVEVPAIVSAPLLVIAPVAVAARLPPTVELPKSIPVALTRVALPLVPLVVIERSPVTANSSSVISASSALVVKAAVPLTVTVSSSVRFPVVAVAVRLPSTVELPKSMPVALTRVAFPLVPLVV